MTKLKKSQRVEIYLDSLLRRDDFDLCDLESLKYKDISDVRELEGIGDRTISNVLNTYKVEKGIELPKLKSTKKQLVEDYLNELMESGEFTRSELLRVSYNDLKDVEELQEVGKTTITCALAEFKQKHDCKSFEKGVLDFLEQEKDEVCPAASINSSENVFPVSARSNSVNEVEVSLNGANMKLVKKMISEFEQLKSADEEKKLYELRELKHALHFVGINPAKIVRLYWEDVSKDFMNRKILSGATPAQSDLKVSGFM